MLEFFNSDLSAIPLMFLGLFILSRMYVKSWSLSKSIGFGNYIWMAIFSSAGALTMSVHPELFLPFLLIIGAVGLLIFLLTSGLDREQPTCLIGYSACVLHLYTTETSASFWYTVMALVCFLLYVPWAGYRLPFGFRIVRSKESEVGKKYIDLHTGRSVLTVGVWNLFYANLIKVEDTCGFGLDNSTETI